MIVETNNGIQKVSIRDRVFIAVDENCKKISNSVIRTNNIKNVLWLKQGKPVKIPTNDFLDLMYQKDFYGLN